MLYNNAIALCDTSRAVAEYISQNKNVLHLYKSQRHCDIVLDAMLNDTVRIPFEINNAVHANTIEDKQFSLRFIYIMTNNILSYCRGLELETMTNKEYIGVLKHEIKLFRKQYKKWRKSISM
mgnify:CR=1 FL=1